MGNLFKLQTCIAKYAPWDLHVSIVPENCAIFQVRGLLRCKTRKNL